MQYFQSFVGLLLHFAIVRAAVDTCAHLLALVDRRLEKLQINARFSILFDPLHHLVILFLVEEDAGAFFADHLQNGNCVFKVADVKYRQCQLQVAEVAGAVGHVAVAGLAHLALLACTQPRV